jgi:peptide/nickel transport system substrate-binding protein
MTKRKAATLVAVAALVAAFASTVAFSATPPKAEKVTAGGTYRIDYESAFGFTDSLDPTGEYLGEAFAILGNLLVRTLTGYNHMPDAAGNQLVPDIATAIPKPTNGGKTYTFKLKNGVTFGPPVSRPVTSKDIAYAMERLAKPKNGAQYAGYYNVIKGFEDFGKGKAKKIAGISTPNDRTIVFNLTKPTIDFLYRLAMPATGPIPQEVAKCFEGKPGQYGRNLVSTAGYMLEGSDKVDASSCSTIKPASGFDGQTKLHMVRNPDYKASSDSKKARSNFVDRFEINVNANVDDIFNKLKAGDLEGAIATEPSKIIREYTTNSSLRSRLKQGSGDRTWYLTMNLTQPPFDDIHVRKAMNWVMDKDALRKVWGGPTVGDIATHIAPDPILNNVLKGYDPYKTPGGKGSVPKAAAEMKQSKYDANKDGKCDAKECKGVLMISDTRGVDPGMVAVIQSSAAKIGITFTVRQIKGAYPTIQTPSKNIPFAQRAGWGKDWADPGTFYAPLFDGRTIIPSGNTNYSLVGITPEKAKELKVTGNVTNVVNVDKDIDTCAPLTDTARVQCYARLDRKLMEQVVPWVPWMFALVTHIVGPNVTKFQFDQFSTDAAWAHVAMKG